MRRPSGVIGLAPIDQQEAKECKEKRGKRRQTGTSQGVEYVCC